MWELQRVWWTDSDANWRKTHSDLLLGEVLGWDVTSVWALMWTSATKNFSNLDLSHANSKIWSTPSQSTFTPIALNLISFLARRNNWDITFFSSSLLRVSKSTGCYVEVLRSHPTRPCSTLCSHIKSKTSYMLPSFRTTKLIFTQPTVDQAFYAPQTLITEQQFVNSLFKSRHFALQVQ